MKNTTFAFMFALISILGIHSAASAQFLPASEAILNNAHLAQLVSSNTATTAITAVPASTLNTATLVPMSTTVAQLPTYTAASAATLNNANIGIMSNVNTNVNPHTQISVQAYPNATTLLNSGLVPMINGNIPQTPVVPPVTVGGGNTGNTAYSSGSYGSGTHAVAAPTVTYTAPAQASTPVTTKVVYKYVNANPIAESISQSIAELPADTISDRSEDITNNYAASTHGLGQVNLVTVLLAVAVLLAGLVAYQQYQDRKKKAQYAVYA